MAIARSKYTGDRMNYQGDPGFFGDIFKGIAKVGLGVAGSLPFVGGAAKLASGYLFPPAAGTQTYSQMPRMGIMPPRPTAGPGGAGGIDCSGNWSTIARRAGMSVSAVQSACATQAAGGRAPLQIGPVSFPMPFLGDVRGRDPGPGEAFETTTAMLAGKPSGYPGYHWNKSGYFLMSGEYVAPGTKAVRNRRRNPANPRATSNAITRIRGAKRYAKALSAISIRKKC